MIKEGYKIPFTYTPQKAYFKNSKSAFRNSDIELYKIEENLSNEIMSSIFPPRLIKYNLRTQTDFFRNSVNSSKYGLNSIRFFASKVWQMVPMEMKNLKSLEDFKNKIRKWEPDGCDCKLCKDFVSNLGYVNLV